MKRAMSSLARKKPTVRRRRKAANDAVIDTRGDKTRRHIKKVIAQLAKTNEIYDFTLSDVCQATDITTGALYFHFKSKEDAIEEMVIDQVHVLYEALAASIETDDVNDYIAGLISHTTAYHKKYKRLPRAIQVVINTRPKAYEAWLAARAPIIDRMSALIGAAREAQNLSAKPSRYLAHYLLTSIEDLGMDAFQWRNPTLAPYARNAAKWNKDQAALWTWSILAPLP